MDEVWTAPRVSESAYAGAGWDSPQQSPSGEEQLYRERGMRRGGGYMYVEGVRVLRLHRSFRVFFFVVSTEQKIYHPFRTLVYVYT